MAGMRPRVWSERPIDERGGARRGDRRRSRPRRWLRRGRWAASTSRGSSGIPACDQSESATGTPSRPSWSAFRIEPPPSLRCRRGPTARWVPADAQHFIQLGRRLAPRPREQCEVHATLYGEATTSGRRGNSAEQVHREPVHAVMASARSAAPDHQRVRGDAARQLTTNANTVAVTRHHIANLRGLPDRVRPARLTRDGPWPPATKIAATSGHPLCVLAGRTQCGRCG